MFSQDDTFPVLKLSSSDRKTMNADFSLNGFINSLVYSMALLQGQLTQLRHFLCYSRTKICALEKGLIFWRCSVIGR